MNVTNIRELRAALDELESQWTHDDDQALGKFGDQNVVVPVYEWDKVIKAAHYRGYTYKVEVRWDITGLGLLIEDAPQPCAQDAPSTVPKV